MTTRAETELPSIKRPALLRGSRSYAPGYQRYQTLGLVAVLAVGAWLRFWNLGVGIPYAIGVDEPEIMTRVLAILKTGDFNPHFFDYPGLTFYLQVPVAIARFLFGAVQGEWNSLDGADPSAFYLWARALTALIGTATVFVTYKLGSRWGVWEGFLAAVLLAVLPLHVRESHFVLADVPATFFAVLTLLVSILASERRSAKMFLWAGVCAGLTVAAKYNAGLVVLFPFVAAVLTPHPSISRTRCAAMALGASLAAFLISAPYTLIDLPGFLNGFARLAAAYPAGDRAAGAEIYLKHLRGAIGWPGLVLVGPGLVVAIRRARARSSRVAAILLVAFPAIYFVTISGRSLIFGRYLLPMLPFVCVLIAVGVVGLANALRSVVPPRLPDSAVVTLLAVMAITVPARISIGFDYALGLRSTNQIAYEWIVQNVPPKSKVVIEKYDLRLPEVVYSVTHVRDLSNRPYEEYVRDGAQYLVASSQAFGGVMDSPQSDIDRYGRYRALFQQSQEVFAVGPKPGRPGPELRVFRLSPHDIQR